MGRRPQLAPPVVPLSVRGPAALRALRVLQAAASAPSVLGEDDAVAYAVALLRRRIRPADLVALGVDLATLVPQP